MADVVVHVKLKGRPTALVNGNNAAVRLGAQVNVVPAVTQYNVEVKGNVFVTRFNVSKDGTHIGGQNVVKRLNFTGPLVKGASVTGDTATVQFAIPTSELAALVSDADLVNMGLQVSNFTVLPGRSYIADCRDAREMIATIDPSWQTDDEFEIVKIGDGAVTLAIGAHILNGNGASTDGVLAGPDRVGTLFARYMDAAFGFITRWDPIPVQTPDSGVEDLANDNTLPSIGLEKGGMYAVDFEVWPNKKYIADCRAGDVIGTLVANSAWLAQDEWEVEKIGSFNFTLAHADNKLNGYSEDNTLNGAARQGKVKGMYVDSAFGHSITFFPANRLNA